MRRLWILIVLMMCGIGLLAYNHAARKPLNEVEVKAIGQAYLDSHVPEWKAEYTLPPKVIDRGSYWEYTFALPANTVGGTPVVYIDKQTRQVTKMFHEQ
jgi:hypothetical protein